MAASTIGKIVNYQTWEVAHLIDITTIPVPPGFRVVPIAATDDPVLGALDRAWTRIRTEDSGIPGLVFDLQPGRTSGCGQIEFDAASPVMIMNLAPSWDGEPETLVEHKLTGAHIAQLLLHQAAHAVAGPTKSQEGRWHPEAFRDAAQRLGLDVERGGTGASGWNKTSLARGTLTKYRPEITALDRAIAQWEPVQVRKRKPSRRGVYPMSCSCSPPRVLRVSETMAKAGQLNCGICHSPFTL